MKVKRVLYAEEWNEAIRLRLRITKFNRLNANSDTKKTHSGRLFSIGRRRRVRNETMPSNAKHDDQTVSTETFVVVVVEQRHHRNTTVTRERTCVLAIDASPRWNVRRHRTIDGECSSAGTNNERSTVHATLDGILSEDGRRETIASGAFDTSASTMADHRRANSFPRTSR